MTISIDPKKLQEIKKELNKWKTKKSATLRETQSLVGKLNFAATTVHAGRLFFSRVLNFLRTIPAKGNEEFRKQ